MLLTIRRYSDRKEEGHNLVHSTRKKESRAKAYIQRRRPEVIQSISSSIPFLFPQEEKSLSLSLSLSLFSLLCSLFSVLFLSPLLSLKERKSLSLSNNVNRLQNE